MHDGETYSGMVVFNQDGTLEARFEQSQTGTWNATGATTIEAAFCGVEHVLEFNLETFEAEVIQPARDPPTRMSPNIQQEE